MSGINPNSRETYDRGHNKHCKCYIHPDSKFMKFWCTTIIFLLVYVATIMPYNIAFVDYDTNSSWFYIDTIVDFCFISDVIIHSISGYYDEDNKLVTNRKKIFLTYLKGWFIIDIVASFPFNIVDYIVTDTFESDSGGHIRKASYNKALRLLRLPRLYRLIKLG